MRQIADMAAQDIGIILIKCGAIEPDFAAQRLPKPDHGAGKGGFARARSANDAKRLAGGKRKADAAQGGHLLARGRHGEAGHLKQGAGARQGGAGQCSRLARQERRKPLARLCRAGDQGPLRNGLFDGRKGATHQDRACNHRAARHFALQHEIGADAQNGGLQDGAEGFGGRAEMPRQIARRQAGLQSRATGDLPTGKRRACHPQSQHGFGFGLDAVGHVIGLHRQQIGAVQRGLGGILVQKGDHDQETAPSQRKPA